MRYGNNFNMWNTEGCDAKNLLFLVFWYLGWLLMRTQKWYVVIGFDVQDVVVAWCFGDVMFLGCFSVKISENSETSKIEGCAKSFAIECTKKQQIWWEQMSI